MKVRHRHKKHLLPNRQSSTCLTVLTRNLAEFSNGIGQILIREYTVELARG